MDLTAEIAYCESLGERRSRSNVRQISFIFNEFLMPWWREAVLTEGFPRKVSAYPIGGHKWRVNRLQSGEGYVFSIDALPPEAYAFLPGVKQLEFACSLEFVFQEKPPELPFFSSGMISPRYGARRVKVSGKLEPFALPGQYRLGIKVTRKFYEGGPGSPQNMGWRKEWIEAFSPELKAALAHEYQHLADIVAGGIIGGKKEYSIQASLGQSLEAYFRYRNLPSEVRATARELVAQASKQRLPVVQVLDTMLTRLKRGLERRYIEKAFEETPGAFPALEQQLQGQLEKDLAALRQVYIAEFERRYPRLREGLSEEGGHVPL